MTLKGHNALYYANFAVLAAIFNGKFQAISGRTSETVRDRAKVTINR